MGKICIKLLCLFFLSALVIFSAGALLYGHIPLYTLFGIQGGICFGSLIGMGCLFSRSKRFTEVLEELDVGAWTLDLKTERLKYSTRWVKAVLGWNTGSFSLEEWENSIDPLDRESWRTALNGARQNPQEGLSLRFRLKRHNGTLLWLSMQAKQCEPGTLVGTAYDVTFDAIRAQEVEHKANLLASSYDAVIDIDLSSEICSWDQDAEKLFAYTKEEILGQSISRLFTPYSWKCLTNELLALQNSQEHDPQIIECEALAKTRNKYTLSIKPSRVYINEAGMPRISLTIRDISATAEMREAAYGLLELRGKLITTISRAIRDPMTILEQTLYLIDEQCRDNVDEATRDMLGIAKDNLTKLSGLIHDILDYQQLETGKMELHPDSVDLNQLITQVAQLIKPDLLRKNLSIDLQLVEGDSTITCDGAKIQQVILHLMDNAIKYTEEGGVTVRTRWEENKFTVEITDTGVGIPKEERENIFESFLQLHNTGFHPGAGLGLVFSKKIVELHGGTISFRPEEAGGTTFSITLPKEPDEQKNSDR